MLLGAEIFFQLMLSRQIRMGDDLPVLQETLLGWIVSGKMVEPIGRQSTFCTSINILEHPVEELNLSSMLERFWIVEGTETRSVSAARDQEQIETHFLRTVSQAPSGRLTVNLPFRQDPSVLGNSESSARRRFFLLEKRLQTSEELKQQYTEFIREYHYLGHMEEADGSVLSRSNYFLPHHCVLRPESTSTKLRVVFDASARSENSLSLNNILMSGRPVQPELFDIILRFRLHKFAITADIAKMYRQIMVSEEDYDYQCIYWRDNPQEALRIFRLKTITYGTSAAPYLATRCLNYLADLENANSPLGARIIKNDIYVDDLLTGANSKQEALTIIDEVTTILAKGCFKLRKWCASDITLLADIPEVDREKVLQLQDKDVVKALGISWNPSSDSFHFLFPVGTLSNPKPLTKREILSRIARIFDPLGLINPVTLRAKIFMQELWMRKIDWDEPVPVDLQSKFEVFYNQLNCLNRINFPRFVLSSNSTNTQLHGFSDASNRAYGCCIYLRSVAPDGGITAHLLCAKSRVAPIKSISLPKLELCGAHLLTQLINRIKPTTGHLYTRIYCWTDSKIVLDWLASHPSRWNTFVANRVATIQDLLPNAVWNHVPSPQNPADLVSRGLTPQDLEASWLWMNGPEMLKKGEADWPARHLVQLSNPLEERKSASCLVSSSAAAITDLVRNSKFANSFNKLRRTFAYMLRFVSNCTVPRSNRVTGELTSIELEEAQKTIIWIIQQIEFEKEYRQLDRENTVHPKSSIKALNPFLDTSSKKRLIRVGGRLQNADLPDSIKHPILLPKGHPFVPALINFLHTKHFHAGPQALVAIIRQRFWLINARDVVRKVLRKCIPCIRSRPIIQRQLMGPLPAHRVEPARPFVVCGVDFCGPVWVHYKIRGKRPHKAYIALFICFSTKAVHLEVVSDLSSEAFIASLKRFIARRGHCKVIYCDNATNFVGARRNLEDLYTAFTSQQFQDVIIKSCAEDGMTFKMIPPRTPHFGGLWEAGIKSAKTHLYKTLNSTSLTYEELTTVVTQIEAILNSRPLTPLSSDPSDMEALTPGHFLIGEPLTAIVEPDVTTLVISHLSRWQRLSALYQHFWRRWSTEYVTQLQQRSKWSSPSPNIPINSLVLVADNQLPPQKWLLGRVVEAIKGSDGLVRVVTVRTKNGVIKRGIQKICLIPTDDKSSSLKEGFQGGRDVQSPTVQGNLRYGSTH